MSLEGAVGIKNQNFVGLLQDADIFLSVTQAEENRLLELCSNCEGEMCSSDVPEEGAYHGITEESEI
ncbi:hypothetical protein DPMN_158445 [Dreissena polymorpha]|uniref:Uncharacterized protein n=1 Tax=Dreissena polymorpha TaxID=45954 RepID=A0A9D4ELD5_DREPO|nr:hypothetical protein DPMN_158445 [Dreissena polymorpha]